MGKSLRNDFNKRYEANKSEEQKDETLPKAKEITKQIDVIKLSNHTPDVKAKESEKNLSISITNTAGETVDLT